MSRLTDVLTPAPRQLPIALLFLGVLYTSFTMGALSGAAAVENESLAPADIHADLEQAQHTLEADFEEDYGPIAARGFNIIAMPIIKSGFTVAGWRVDFGFANPDVARVNAAIGEYLAPATMLGAVAWQNIRLLKAVRGWG